MRLCKEALATGPKTTKELALIVMAAKGLDTGDKVLARAMTTRMIHALCAVPAPAARAFGWRRKGEGGAGVGDQVIADSLKKRGRQLLEESERPKEDSSVHRRGGHPDRPCRE